MKIRIQHVSIYLLGVCIFFMIGCRNATYTTISDRKQYSACEKDDSNLLVLFFDTINNGESAFLNDFTKQNSKYSIYYIAQKSLNGETRILYPGFTYATSIIYGYNKIILSSFDAKSLTILSTDNAVLDRIDNQNLPLAFDTSQNKVLYRELLPSAIHEYHIDTKVNTIIANMDFLAAKYDPIDDSIIAYVDYSTKDLHIMKNDGSYNNDILTGYNIKNIVCTTDGTAVIFNDDNNIYKINIDGTNLTHLINFVPPSAYDCVVLFNDKIIFLETNNLVITTF